MNRLSRITLDLARLHPSRVAQMIRNDGYEHHRLIWRLFPGSQEQPRDFLFRIDQERAFLRALVLSERTPVDQDGTWRIETKSFTPRLRAGQRLEFSLRVNPVVTTRGADGRSSRHDVVMHAKKQAHDIGSGLEESESERVQRVANEWLNGRAERAGFSIIAGSVNAERYLQHRLYRRRGVPPVRFSSVDLSGVLTVNDPGCLIGAITSGIGPCKAFGCGLLLIRPAVH